MDVHKPKPVHGWRELLKEIGVIVISVLIAISAEQTVEWLHWRHKVHDAVEGMRMEMTLDDLPQAYVRAATQACLQQQLLDIGKAVEAGEDRAKLRAMTLAYLPLVRTWDQLALNGAIASDIASHAPGDTMGRWASAYNVIPSMQALASREAEDMAALTAGRTQPGPTTATEQDALLLAVQRLKLDNLGLGWESKVLMRTAKDAGASLPLKDTDKILTKVRARYGACATAPSIKTFDLDADGLDPLAGMLGKDKL